MHKVNKINLFKKKKTSTPLAPVHSSEHPLLSLGHVEEKLAEATPEGAGYTD